MGKNRKDCVIIIVTHKEIVNMVKLEKYNYLLVGAHNKNSNFGYLVDSDGENISNKNNNYCELTGAYWLWKNSCSKIKGIVHYRRFFYSNKYFRLDSNLLSNRKINLILDKYDCIVPSKIYYINHTIKGLYKKVHYSNDLAIISQVVKEKYPNYYEEFLKVFEGKEFFPYNMLIANELVYNTFYEWLFNILFEVEKKVDLSNYSDYQKRIFGFMSERLLMVWINKNNIKYYEMPVHNREENIIGCFYKVIRRDCIKFIGKLIKRK